MTEVIAENTESEEQEGTGKRRGYATRSLPVVSVDDERYWSVSDAASILGPPDLSEMQVRQLVHLLNMQPIGKRSGGSRRRHVRVYDAAHLARAYAAIESVLMPAEPE
jgi:hypothetical protein